MPASVPVAPDQSATWQAQGSVDNPATGTVLLAAQLGANERMASITASAVTPAGDCYTEHGFGAVDPGSGEFVLHADAAGSPIALSVETSSANEISLTWTGAPVSGTVYASLSFNLQAE